MSCNVLLYFIGAVNNFIQVRFDFIISTILCIFYDEFEAIRTVKHCEITYGPNAECDNASLISYANGEPSASQTVEISLSLHESSVVTDNQDSYCYTIKGTNGTNTITISGIFVTGI